MKLILTLYIVSSTLIFLYLLKDKLWVRWFYYSLTYRVRLHQIKKNLRKLNENNRLLALIEWLDTDHWFKKYWFGRRVEKFILKEVEKFK